MARLINKLSAIGIARLKRKGLHGDGGGLYLRVSSSGGKFWVFRYMVCGKAREMGLGALHAVSLAEARVEARSNRHMLTNREDPLEVRRKAKAKSQLLKTKKKTFKECAEAYIKSHKSGWRNPKHRQQWSSTLTSYAFPVLGELDVQKIDVSLIMKVLEPLWLTKTETASRLRGRIEVILDWARVRGYRSGENPARWRGHLDNLLPKRSKVQKVKHQPALPYAQIGDFMAELHGQEKVMATLALQFTILTACRTSEAIGATWDEIDFSSKVWIIPETRIKMEKELIQRQN